LIIGRENDSVTSIHKRWHFTQINPSSYKISLAICELCAAALAFVSYSFLPYNNIIVFLAIVLAVGIATMCIFLDYFLLRGTPVNKRSKIIHVSAFAYLLWFMTVVFGLAANFVLVKNNILTGYIIEGMFMAVGLRYCIFTSVFGARKMKSLIAAPVTPVIFLFASLPYFSFDVRGTIIGVGFGFILLCISLIWSIIADRSGRPSVKSTFQVLQAFILAWTEKRRESIETILESKASPNEISTWILSFKMGEADEVHLVLPEIHPGPFSPIGGSDLPYRLFKLFHNRAIVFHSISDHSLNLPSFSEVAKYLDSLKIRELRSESKECSTPVQVSSSQFTVTGIAFSSTALIIASKNTGMEDLPFTFRISIEERISELGFQHILLVDAHNGVGEKIDKDQENDLVHLAISCLKQLRTAKRYPFKVSYSSTRHTYSQLNKHEDIGESGFGVIAFEINDSKYVLGWSDSNNFARGLRHKIIEQAKSNGVHVLELISSDSHTSSGKRTREGYYSLGDKTDQNQIATIFINLARQTLENFRPSEIQVLHSKSKVKLMGADQFHSYSIALEKSMKITKICIALTAAVYLIMLLLS
jgi:putative membrane protein